MIGGSFAGGAVRRPAGGDAIGCDAAGAGADCAAAAGCDGADAGAADGDAAAAGPVGCAAGCACAAAQTSPTTRGALHAFQPTRRAFDVREWRWERVKGGESSSVARGARWSRDPWCALCRIDYP
jgi:hypothetical protein